MCLVMILLFKTTSLITTSMKKVAIYIVGIVTTLLFSNCKNDILEPLNPPQPKESAKIELPKGADISLDAIQIFENGGHQVKVDPDGKFNTTANTLLVLGKEDRILYLSYLSSDTIPSNKKVTLNSLETASSLLLQIFPNVFIPTSTASFESLKNLIAQLQETKQLATAIDRSIVRNGYLNLDDVDREYSIAKEKIIQLAGLKENFLSARAFQKNAPTTRSSTTPISPQIINNRYKGVRLDIKSSNFITESKTWHCNMTGYNERFGYVAMVHAYKGNDGVIYPYSNDFWEQMKFIIPPMNVSKFMGTTSSWGGIKAYFSDTWRLFTEEGFGFGDMTWDMSKLSGIYMDFQKPNDVVLVLSPQENNNLFVFNATMAFLAPAISLLGGEVKDDKSFIKDFTYRFVYKLATDPIFINEIRAIASNKSLSSTDKSYKIYQKLQGKFVGFVTGDAIKLYPKLAKSLANKAFKKAITDVNFYEKVVKLTGDLVMGYFGLAEHGFYFDMKLDFGQEDVPNGVIIENGVLVEWPNEAIPASGHVIIPDAVKKIGNRAFFCCNKLTSITIPNSVTYIGYEAFSGCNKMTSITIPNSVTYIGYEAFRLCKNLISITISNSVTCINDETFADCLCLTNVDIPNSVESINKGAFSDCTSLKKISIPNSVISIGNYAFSRCLNLASITLPNSVRSIGNGALNDCSSLASITLPNSLRGIGDGALNGCSNLASVICKATIPPFVTDYYYGGKGTLGYVRKIVVPIGTKLQYEQANAWKECSPIVEEDL